MFEKIFYEKDIENHPKTQFLLNKFSQTPNMAINRVDDIFGRVKKPYLQKRTNLNLFIGSKRGQLVKETPSAYGLSGEPHYYFIHSYNCLYECDYCYLQGYFHSPDLVFFINHEDILNEMENVVKTNREKGNKTIWFHAGEYSDSLALSHLTKELPQYFDFFKKNPEAKLELRTKSANIRELKELSPLKNVIASFSLSPKDKIKDHDLKTPPLKARIKAIETLKNLGHPIALHFDPIIYGPSFKEDYKELLKSLMETINPEDIEYISFGVVRFTKEVYHQVKKNYPDSKIHHQEFIKSFDGKVRYMKPQRLWMLQTIKDLCLNQGFKEEQLYLCMEAEDSE
ncbi:MAG: hypothetical protein CME68_07985 [Halobacteriovoraceae bacterium]|nr:hypothetical protein [Halobacteriovoraceae bacterium]